MTERGFLRSTKATAVVLVSTLLALALGLFISREAPSGDPAQALQGPTNLDHGRLPLTGGADWDFSYGIAVDSSGDAYVMGWTRSTDFPTKNPLQAGKAGPSYTLDTFVAKPDSSGSALVYSTYLGGSNDDGFPSLPDIAVDSSGSAHVVGLTYSTDFPTTAGNVYVADTWNHRVQVFR